ncbi:type VII secretion protein EccB [Nocardioides litoris]|uniref:type VII secretion protein EccB n=1 Tax=Nocardioides litoris TaxID=1926648 RepID=UPI001121255F|nr:type VII secretion protein EccB [Nocardioides litoris]
MATKKDLVEAHAFSRRRLVAAFVSGAPGGREVEPARPARTVAAGLAVAVLVLAGSAVYGALASPSTADLDTPGLVTERGTGSSFLLLPTDDPDDGDALELRSLANVTSALLVLGDGVRASEATTEELAALRRGAPVGIPDAPEAPPPADDLVQGGWVACTADGAGTRVSAGSPDDGAAVDAAVAGLVRSTTGDLFLLAPSAEGGVHALPVPSGPTDPSPDPVLDAVAATPADAAVVVPDAFVELLPAGAPLARSTFGLDDASLGSPWPVRTEVADLAVRARAQVGDLLEVDDRTYLTTPDGVRPLDAFERAVWRAVGRVGTDAPAVYDDVASLGDVDFTAGEPTSWPAAPVPSSAPATAGLCAVLDTSGPAPAVLLATTDAGSPVAADGLVPDAVARSVAPGRGALARPEADAPPVLVDDRGTASELGDADVQRRLGYAGTEPVVVPPAWLGLFAPGPDLTVAAARCPDTPDDCPGA